MIFLEKLVEGWVHLVHAHGCSASLLADDLKVVTEEVQEDRAAAERETLARHRDCVGATLAFFRSMGARIAADKSLSLASTATVRAALQRQRWDGQRIPTAWHA